MGECESCGQVAELRRIQFVNGAVEAVCHDCVEAWALEFGGAAMEALNQWQMPEAKDA